MKTSLAGRQQWIHCIFCRIWADGLTDGPMNRQTDWLTERQTKEWTDIIPIQCIIKVYDIHQPLFDHVFPFYSFFNTRGSTDGWTDRPTDGLINRQRNRASYRDTWMHLKISFLYFQSIFYNILYYTIVWPKILVMRN